MVKTLPENHADVVALREVEKKLASLKTQKRRGEATLDAMRSEYARFMSLTKDERLQQQADALLAEQPTPTVTKDDLERAARNLEVLTAAIERQMRAVVLAGRKPNDLLHELNFDQYTRNVRRIADAVAELAAANEEEARFFEELRTAGATSIRFRRMGLASVGTLRDSQSPASFHRREVAEHLPEALAS